MQLSLDYMMHKVLANFQILNSSFGGGNNELLEPPRGGVLGGEHYLNTTDMLPTSQRQRSKIHALITYAIDNF